MTETVRVPEPVYERAQEVAEQNDVSLTAAFAIMFGEGESDD
jgi:hypothetical protein